MGCNVLKQHTNGTYCWGNDVPILDEETKAIWKYWKNKKSNHSPEKQFLLSASEIVKLMGDAGITTNDIGKSNHQYALARHNDTGHYEMGNCRFTTVKENQDEQKPSTKPSFLARTKANSRSVTTPYGEYASMNEAVRELAMNKNTLRWRCESAKIKWKDWRFA